LGNATKSTRGNSSRYSRTSTGGPASKDDAIAMLVMDGISYSSFNRVWNRSPTNLPEHKRSSSEASSCSPADNRLEHSTTLLDPQLYHPGGSLRRASLLCLRPLEQDPLRIRPYPRSSKSYRRKTSFRRRKYHPRRHIVFSLIFNVAAISFLAAFAAFWLFAFLLSPGMLASLWTAYLTHKINKSILRF
jgi:hypothetical protein